ncbi:hypothetical protein CHELA1G11_11957 [Hyphomicrobiales bacterium]|nr:hypothetical protein CHELA1G11_11957 [Hyphomicrobiales bacterium]CAH1664278.1 hypothetical protein CHELA1G2_12353 [Hyphomicrobiales bacterium]
MRMTMGVLAGAGGTPPILAVPSVYFVDGDTSHAFYSTDGINYSDIGIPPGISAGGLGKWVKGPDGTYVACPNYADATANGVYVSANPLAGWTFKTLSEKCRDVCHDGTRFLVCGNNGYLAYATDPLGTWTTWITSVSSTLHGVMFNNSKYIVVGANSYLRSATGAGGSLTSRFSGAAADFFFVKVDTTNNRWWAGGPGGALRYSADGSAATSNWSTHTSNTTAQMNRMDVNLSSGLACYVCSTGRRGYSATPQSSGSWTESAPFGGGGNMWEVKYSPLLGLWIATGVGVLRTAATPDASWTDRVPSGFSFSQGLIVTG